jgi:hypothetical protein
VSLLFAQESCTCLTVLVLLCYPAEANVIYLETPAGVGYSYSADAAYYQGVDDNMTGTDVFVLLSSLFIYFPTFFGHVSEFALIFIQVYFLRNRFYRHFMFHLQVLIS